MKVNDEVDVQIIANIVVSDEAGRVLLTQYNPSVDKWWLPGGDVEPFTHPDEQAKKILGDLNVTTQRLDFKRVQSFRGRRGWHLVFDYLAVANADVVADATWFNVSELPEMMHGEWEKSVVGDLLES